jgi:putative endonuclease
MFFYTYILQSQKNKSLYIGYTSDLKRRLQQHNSGRSLSTKPFAPYTLIFYEAFRNRLDAKNREEYLKGGYGRKSIHALLKKYLEATPA